LRTTLPFGRRACADNIGSRNDRSYETNSISVGLARVTGLSRMATAGLGDSIWNACDVAAGFSHRCLRACGCERTTPCRRYLDVFRLVFQSALLSVCIPYQVSLPEDTSRNIIETKQGHTAIAHSGKVVPLPHTVEARASQHRHRSAPELCSHGALSPCVKRPGRAGRLQRDRLRWQRRCARRCAVM